MKTVKKKRAIAHKPLLKAVGGAVRFIVTDGAGKIMRFYPRQYNELGAFCYLSYNDKLHTYTKKEAVKLIEITRECRQRGNADELRYTLIELKNYGT